MNLDLQLNPSQAEREPLFKNVQQGGFSILIRDEQKNNILGGVTNTIADDWIYVDLLWMDDSLRGKGYGTKLMQAVETYAVQHDLAGIYLFTADFQARPFYEKLGYLVFGQQPERPTGHRIYYLSKTNLKETPIDERLQVVTAPSAEIRHFLDMKLMQHASTYVPLDSTLIAVFLRDDMNLVKGGIFGELFWEWFDLRVFSLDEAHTEWGDALIEMIDAEAQRLGAKGIVTHTAHHAELFRRHGYTVFGTLKDCPPKGETIFFEKRF